jgi:phytoene synthase
MTPSLAAKLPKAWTYSRPEAGWHQSTRLQDSFQYCRSVTRHHARSFYFSSFPLPDDKKLAAYAIYAFCRYIDDIIDESEDCGSGNNLNLAPTRDILRNAVLEIEKGDSSLPFAVAFREVNRQYGIENNLYFDLIEGCCRDREPVEIKTFEELEEYCYYVASVVGLMMSKIFGLKEPDGIPYAVDMGIAMQLTNILRDVKEDFDMGRIYLPEEEWASYSVSRDHFEHGLADTNWKAYLKMQVDRARDYYQRGEEGLRFLDNDGSRKTAALMAKIYSGILDVIEKRDYDVFQGRAFVPTWKKLLIAFQFAFQR